MKLQIPASIWIALLSLVVASASLFVSFRTQQLSVADELVAQLSIPDKNSLIQLSHNDFGELGTLITAPFEFTMTNGGNRKLSVTRYEVYALNSWGGKSWYSGIDGGLLDAKGKPLYLPLVLDIGESAIGYIRVGMLANSAAIRVLKSTKPAASISRRDIDLTLAKQGMDLFGNEVVLKQYSGDSYSIEGPGPGRKLPNILVVFQTGKGVVVPTEASWYP